MIITYLYDLSELNKMGDVIVLNVKDYSFDNGHNFSVDEILDIKSKTEKKIFLSLTPLYHDKDFDGLEDVIKRLKDLDGFIFQDLGLIDIFLKLNITNKAIYAPETFITNHIDKEYFSVIGINKFLISREITLEDIKMILKFKGSSKYMYSAFGYQMLFYSYRPHLSNFKSKYNLKENLKGNLNLSIKEETRCEFYRVIEDNLSFRIYKDKILNTFDDIKELPLDMIILDRIFIDDDMYFDAVSLFKGELTQEEFYNKYSKDLFEKGYLYKETGLLKEDEANA